jgi:two-component system chemotaxis family response regulator WspR
VIAFAGVVVGVLLNRLALDQIIPHTATMEWIFEAGVSWEAILLALAVASRLNDTVKENAMLHASEVSLQKLAAMDGLTGLFNRRAFDQRLEFEWNRARRTGRALAMLLVDVDFFKLYNDSRGHLAGDDALRRVASTLSRSASRSSDFCARYGGEEFAVLLTEADISQAIALAERIRKAVQDLSIPQDAVPARCVTISVGVAACVPIPSLRPHDLIASADRALYGAKHGGRNAVVASAQLP